MSHAETHNPQAITSQLDRMTLAEAITMAQEFEAAAADFYRELARRLNTEASTLAHELANEEEQHGLMLRALAAQPGLAQHLRQRIAAPASTPAFCTFITPLDLPAEPQEDELLAYAKSREEIAREHYGYLAELAAPGPLRDLFAFFAHEEQRHADHLDQRWSELFAVF